MSTTIELPGGLPLARYRITFVPHKPLQLPKQPEISLRGGLGLALKQGACIRPTGDLCTACTAPEICPYAYLFEGRTPPDAEVLSASNTVPQPYVFAAAHEQTTIAPGEAWPFTLTLIGHAIRYLPYLIAALRVLATQGLGEQRVHCTLASVDWLTPDGLEQVLYKAQGSHRLRTQPAPLSVQVWAGMGVATEQLTLHLQTPTRLKYADAFIAQAPPFHVLVRTLLRRVSALSYFHGGRRWETDYRGWIARAETVTTTAAAVQWQDWSRYSTRTQRRMPLGGLVGTVTYQGDLTPFLPLLRLGELIHVGKNAVFGNGRFVIGSRE
ncbi:MAG: CRISPR system precrRNA processing endoribonuclease RAMP protein Cas6 [Caldilinea sp. CFX5]|nr:CRISPR system precrRNA processing endoribonuclease RAMP protein Cas6 [Caldilinea sp. CFX5]